MIFPRASGILLHPSSLPGRYGIGDLGHYAYRFVDYLVETGQQLWQVLPLGPTGYGDSPYQSLSTFAGNTNLISLDRLREAGWLSDTDLADTPDYPVHKVDYGWVIPFHDAKLRLAHVGFRAHGEPESKQAYAAWCSEHADWLDDYALFAALKAENDLKPWTQWPDKGEALYEPTALQEARERLASEIAFVKFGQWVFFSQWHDLRRYANERNVRIIGDIPIFVAHDSSDVWANRADYTLDADGMPELVAGVPPDYFSPTGQYWGNPLYRWDRMKADGYRWWVRRMRAVLSLVDIVRIDHFRGFEDYWEIPVNEEETAVNGRWLKGPNVGFFDALKAELGDALPIIAEDLGDITPEVHALRNTLNLPGMKVLQFAWDKADNDFLPHNYESNNFIVYTGTHDNNTTLGWWHEEATDGDKQYMQAYLDRAVSERPHHELMRLGMMSAAHTFIAPFQDVLGFGADTRMNIPGKTGGMWSWRFTEDWLHQDVSRQHLIHLTRVYNRWPQPKDTTT